MQPATSLGNILATKGQLHFHLAILTPIILIPTMKSQMEREVVAYPEPFREEVIQEEDAQVVQVQIVQKR